MAYQVVVKLSIFPCIKAEKGDPVWGVDFQKPVKESETVEGHLSFFQVIAILNKAAMNIIGVQVCTTTPSNIW